jgi:superfamily II DNA or RNA helicase
VIVDEAHHVGAWCPREVLEMMVAPARLGLTATPSANIALEQHVGPVVYTIGIDDLRGDSLADYVLHTIPIALAEGERERYRTLRGQFAAHYAAVQRSEPQPWREFVRTAQRSERGRDALAAWRASRALLAYPQGKRDALRELLQRHEGDRVLVFTADNATAYAIARELLVMPVTCDIRRRERAAMIERFRSGETPVLVSAQVLDEGFDVPDAEVAIVVGGTGSERRHVQRVGRVLRPRPGKLAVVYELAVQASAEVSQVVRRRRGLAQAEQTEVWS